MITKNVGRSLVGLMFVILLVPIFALGATMKVGEEVVISKGNDIQDNVYVAGGNVSLNSVVSGDLFTAGGNVLITEEVAEDILAVGGSITILADGGDDVRIAGGNVLVAGSVAGELIVVGGAITVSSEVVVEEDLIVAGGQVSIDGEVLGDGEIAAGVVSIHGHVAGDMSVIVDEKLTIGDGAVIDGALKYSARSADALIIHDDATVTGEIVFNEIDVPQKAEAENALVAIIGALVLFKLVSYIVVALILVWLFKNFSNSVVRGVARDPLKMLGYGFVTVIVVPVAAILLFATLLGIPLGILAVLSYGLIMLISAIYAGVVVGAWLSQILRKSETPVVTWKNVIGGIVLLTAISLVPVVGWVVGLLAFFMTVGSIVNIVHHRIWSER